MPGRELDHFHGRINADSSTVGADSRGQRSDEITWPATDVGYRMAGGRTTEDDQPGVEAVTSTE
ncbi:hypothetical protein GCM10009764_29760 [Nocardia ninae]|uniref:Uncharacterized protein n=1 Tax=Nocardia ninae NBRC 108245 TaxID=1210091 RepID=A0A511MFP8_9NOCA|nr:hypothetical protein NN4_39080 [Nocardia ninae NBRC 108245]